MASARLVRIVILALVVVVGLSLPDALAQNTPKVMAVYKTSSVSERDTAVSMTFALRLFNLSQEELSIQKVVLGDPANAQNGGWARWEKVVVPPNDKIELQDSVTIPVRAYKAWKAGAPAGIFLVTGTDEGDTIASRISATFQPQGW